MSAPRPAFFKPSATTAVVFAAVIVGFQAFSSLGLLETAVFNSGQQLRVRTVATKKAAGYHSPKQALKALEILAPAADGNRLAAARTRMVLPVRISTNPAAPKGSMGQQSQPASASNSSKPPKSSSNSSIGQQPSQLPLPSTNNTSPSGGSQKCRQQPCQAVSSSSKHAQHIPAARGGSDSSSGSSGSRAVIDGQGSRHQEPVQGLASNSSSAPSSLPSPNEAYVALCLAVKGGNGPWNVVLSSAAALARGGVVLHHPFSGTSYPGSMQYEVLGVALLAGPLAASPPFGHLVAPLHCCTDGHLLPCR
jgi:hypothetical protein